MVIAHSGVRRFDEQAWIQVQDRMAVRVSEASMYRSNGDHGVGAQGLRKDGEARKWKFANANYEQSEFGVHKLRAQ